MSFPLMQSKRADGELRTAAFALRLALSIAGSALGVWLPAAGSMRDLGVLAVLSPGLLYGVLVLAPLVREPELRTRRRIALAATHFAAYLVLLRVVLAEALAARPVLWPTALASLVWFMVVLYVGRRLTRRVVDPTHARVALLAATLGGVLVTHALLGQDFAGSRELLLALLGFACAQAPMALLLHFGAAIPSK